MRQIFAILVTTLFLAPASPAGLELGTDPEPLPLSHPITTVAGGTAEQRSVAEWALAQFASAGLALPVLEITVHEDAASCRGNRGMFGSASTPWRVSLCTEDRMVALHELGHAWAELWTSEAERDRYVALRGLDSWNDPNTAWGKRGFEDAADVIAWGLLPGPIRRMAPDGPLAAQNDAFRALTGVDSPRVESAAPDRVLALP